MSDSESSNNHEPISEGEIGYAFEVDSDQVVKWRAAIRAHFAAFPPLQDLKLEAVEIDGDGDLAYVRGQYTMTNLIEGADPVQDKGKFLEMRRKQKDGTWLYIQDMYSSDLGSKP